MTARYTQGEWRVERAADGMNLWVGCERYTIATVSHVANEVNMGEMEANANLIAAAPDMVRALQAMLEVFGDEFGMGDSETVDMARAAISKAAGATHV